MSEDTPPKCTATNRDGSPCGAYPLQGRDKCRMHAGTSADGESHEGNGNAITHGATADPVNLYQHLDDVAREWVDKLVEGYLQDAPFGEDSPKVERLRMTCIVIYQEWSAREVVLQAGPSEDTVVGVNDAGAPIARTEEHHLVGTAAKHNQTVRMNLKDLGLLDDPGSQQADATRSLAQLLSGDDE